MNNIASKVQDLITPIVEPMGYTIVEVEYAKKSNGMNLTVFIDSSNGIGLDDCEKVHNSIDAPLDELDPTEGASYTLNVSSPGLDRPLKTDKDLSLSINKEIDISLYAKQNGKKDFVGVLKAFDENTLTIISGSEIALDRKNISKITKHISF